MQWHLARCKRKLLSGAYEIAPLKYGYIARYNPTLHPMANMGLHSGGRVQLGVVKVLEEAKKLCEQHAHQLPA